MSSFQPSPVAQRSSRMKELKKLWKLACSCRFSWSFTKANIYMPITLNKKIKRSKSAPKLPRAGRDSMIVSLMIFSLYAFLTSRKTLRMRMIRIIIACCLRSIPMLSSLISHATSVRTTTAKSNLFHLSLK